MRNFKMKDLMIRIQPETSGNTAFALQDVNVAGHNFGTCISPSTTCTSALSCKPSRCENRPKPKPKRQGGELSEDIMDLSDLKNILADMQIKKGSHARETVAML